MHRFASRGAVAAILLTLAAAPPASAQTDPAAPTPATPAAPPTPTFPASQLAAAEDFIRASNITSGFGDMIPQFLDQTRLRYVNQRPEIANLINDAALGVVPEFVQRQNALIKDLAPLYAARFSEDELKQLADFYRTDLGKKLSKEQIDVLQASVPVVQAWSRKLADDIAARIKDEVGKKGQKL